jgi:hypothetical protein
MPFVPRGRGAVREIFGKRVVQASYILQPANGNPTGVTVPARVRLTLNAVREATQPL